MDRYEEIHVFHYATHSLVWTVITSRERNDGIEGTIWTVPAREGFRWQSVWCDIFLTREHADERANEAHKSAVDLNRLLKTYGAVALYVDGVKLRDSAYLD